MADRAERWPDRTAISEARRRPDVCGPCRPCCARRRRPAWARARDRRRRRDEGRVRAGCLRGVARLVLGRGRRGTDQHRATRPFPRAPAHRLRRARSRRGRPLPRPDRAARPAALSTSSSSARRTPRSLSGRRRTRSPTCSRTTRSGSSGGRRRISPASSTPPARPARRRGSSTPTAASAGSRSRTSPGCRSRQMMSATRCSLLPHDGALRDGHELAVGGLPGGAAAALLGDRLLGRHPEHGHDLVRLLRGRDPLSLARAGDGDRDHQVRVSYGASAPADLRIPWHERFGFPLVEGLRLDGARARRLHDAGDGQAGDDGRARRPPRAPRARRARPPRAHRRPGRDRRPSARLERDLRRLLEPSRGHAPRLPQPLVPQRRCRLHGRRRAPRLHRPAQGLDPAPRREHQLGRGRGRGSRPRRRRRVRRLSGPVRAERRRGDGRARARDGCDARRAVVLRAPLPADAEVRRATLRPDHGRAAEDPDPTRPHIELRGQGITPDTIDREALGIEPPR